MNYDWTAGIAYWDRTRDFWNEVRNQWDKKIDKSNNFKLKREVNGRSHIMRLFELASNYEKGDNKIIDNINLILRNTQLLKSKCAWLDQIKQYLLHNLVKNRSLLLSRVQ